MMRSGAILTVCVGLVLGLAGCSFQASPSIGEATHEPTAAPPSEGGPPMEGPTDLPPTPPTLPPALEQVDATVSTNQTGPVTDDGTTRYLIDMTNNADRVWTAWFKGEGFAEPYVFLELIQPGDTYTNESCWMQVAPNKRIWSYTSDFPNAFYCDVAARSGLDKGIIVIPVTSFTKLWTGDIYGTQVTDPKAIGDFAAGVVLSHEFGHHVGAELAVSKGIAPMARGKNKELLADCFAGVHAYALSLGTDGRLDPGDVDEALAALAALGDKTENPTDPHGTPDERRSAFTLGFGGNAADPRGGVPNNCLLAYWPAAARTAG